jgi:hypothetical protein
MGLSWLLVALSSTRKCHEPRQVAAILMLQNKKTRLDLLSWVVKPLHNGESCDFQAVVYFHLAKGDRMMKLVMNSDWLIGKTSTRIANLRKMVEKQNCEKARDRN